MLKQPSLCLDIQSSTLNKVTKRLKIQAKANGSGFKRKLTWADRGFLLKKSYMSIGIKTNYSKMYLSKSLSLLQFITIILKIRWFTYGRKLKRRVYSQENRREPKPPGKLDHDLIFEFILIYSHPWKWRGKR